MDHGQVFFHRPPAGDELFATGRVYSPSSPSLAAIAAQPGLLNGLEAQLALVHYDAAANRWRLVRDFGATPLYYSPTPDGFFWSFTLKGLLNQLPQPPRPDEGVMFDYLATHYRHVFRQPERTFHEGVFQVPAGCYVDMGEGGREERIWADFSPDADLYRLGPEEATEGLMAILRENVRLRAQAAEKPAFTVSSGLDSSTVASLASRDIGDMRVFSVGYEGPGVGEFDETGGVAQLVADHPDWRYTPLTLGCPDLIGETASLVRLTQSPVVTVTWLSYYLMARRMAGFKEVFNGLGGDESLAGEFLHFFYFFADLKAEGQTERLKEEVAAWSRLHDHPVFKKNERVLADHWARCVDFATGDTRVDNNVYRANWRFFNPEWLREFGGRPVPLPRPYPNFLSNRLYQEIRYETTPPTLWGLFMANQALGLTGVSPFLSPRLFKYCLALPGAVKYDHGLTKALLRRGLKGVLPEGLRLNPKKTGFNAPMHQWFRQKDVAGGLREILADGPLAKNGWLRPGAAGEILREHASGAANHMMLLWALLNASLFI